MRNERSEGTLDDPGDDDDFTCFPAPATLSAVRSMTDYDFFCYRNDETVHDKTMTTMTRLYSLLRMCW